MAYAVKEAVKEAKEEKATAIASQMKKRGMPIAQIAEFTELSEEEIEKL